MAASSSSRRQQQSSVACRDWQASGWCVRGSQCRYLHGAGPRLEVIPGGKVQRQRDPVDVLFVLDVSGSMSGSKLTSAKAGICKIHKQLNGKDRLGLISFNSHVRTVLPLGSVTARELKAQLDSIEADGGTSFRDAVIEGVNTFKRTTAPPGKRHLELIVLTDGEDGCSRVPLSELVQTISEPGVPHFHLVLIGVGMEAGTRLQLRELCRPKHCKYIDVEASADAIRIAIKTIIKKRLVVVSGAQVCKEFLQKQSCHLGAACPREHIVFKAGAGKPRSKPKAVARGHSPSAVGHSLPAAGGRGHSPLTVVGGPAFCGHCGTRRSATAFCTTCGQR